MLFNSAIFLLIFLPATLIAFHVSAPRLRLPLIAVASLIFYGYAGFEALAAMLMAIIWVHVFLRYRFVVPRAWRMAVLISVPLASLILFRYLKFILDSVGASEVTQDSFSFFLDVAVPAGISFYTFQLIAYAVDVLEGRVAREERVDRLTAFIALFPQLVAGPIVRFAEIKDQLRRIETEKKIETDALNGFRLIAIGLFFKIVFADGLNLLHGQFVAASGAAGIGDRWLSILIYSFQIFYDFFAYSTVAIGLGLLLGLRLPLNFNRPYLALNPQEFWRRWHMTLSGWLRDYVYFRLGGRKQVVRNLIVVFLCVGLWHGADWSFVVWGAYHAALMLLFLMIRSIWDRLPGFLQIALTFGLVSLGWPLFFYDLSDYAAFLPGLIQGTDETLVVYQFHEILFVASIAVFTFMGTIRTSLIKRILWRIMGHPASQALVIALLFLILPLSTPFIYFRF
jgi:alginate O-acetyltransferase complex protein AlgI